MWQRRLTVFRDAPDAYLLREISRCSWRLYKWGSDGPWFLDDYDGPGEPPALGGHYESLVHVPHLDTTEFDVFLNAHKDRIEKDQIHREMLVEAIYLSSVFSTRVMSSYSDDERSDFATVAESGELKRLRFNSHEEKVRKLSDDEARLIETEIEAVNVSANASDTGAGEVFEFVSYGVVKTEGSVIQFQPSSRYIEGEIGRRVVFRTLWHATDDLHPNQFAGNAHIELKHSFGLELPDYPEDIDDFELVERHEISAAQNWVNTFAMLADMLVGLARYLFRSHPLKLIGLVVVLAIVFFAPERAPRRDSLTVFEIACLGAAGEPVKDKTASSRSPGLGDRCLIEGTSYPEHLIPASPGDERSVAVFFDHAPCQADNAEICLTLEGEEFGGEIEGFDGSSADRGFLFIERTTLCMPDQPGLCEDGSPAFRYVLRRQIVASPRD